MIKKMKQAILLPLLLTMVLSLVGCSNDKVDDAKQVASEEITQQIKAKYAKSEAYNYQDPMDNVERDHAFTFDLEPVALETFKEITDNWSTIINVYKDSNLTQAVAFKADSDETSVTISPFRNPVYALPDEALGGTLYDVGEWNDWGNANQYYLVQYYDLKTGEILEKPEVTVFSIKTEITATPEVAFYISKKGIGGLKWDKIKDADEYAVVLISEYKNGNSSGRDVEIIATTKDTYWEDISTEAEKVNWNFRLVFDGGKDTLYKEYKEKIANGEMTLEEYSQMQYNGESEFEQEQNFYFAVVAMNKKGTSKVSNFINQRLAASQTPVNVAYSMNEGGIYSTGGDARAQINRDIALTPSHTWVIMGDGNVTQMLVNYDVSKVKKDTVQYTTYEEDEEGNMINPQFEDVSCLSVPYTIDGTNFKGYVQILGYDEKTYKEDLQTLKERQDALRNKTGDISKDVNLNKTPKNEDKTAKSLYNDYEIYASNALSEYLALQMLNGQTRINLDKFKEASDQEYLLDAWYEAIYQNPLILGVRGISYDGKHNDVIITYDFDAKTQRNKQKEVIKMVAKITKEIIKEDMSNLEKEEVINDYLCANAVYDMDALENAEKNDFGKVDNKFLDSFTAYGILINQKGVCAGYAGSFKLLADKAGLESIVVTGYLQGSLPHAWNRVNLEDGWYTLDVTNNANEYFSNGLFNLSDDVAKDVLTADDLYVVDSNLAMFAASVSDKEYYRYTNRFFDQNAIVDVLVADLNSTGSATYRTDYAITEDQFNEIANKVIEKTGVKNLRGGYFLGIINLQK